MAYRYATLDDIKNYCDNRVLVQLTNDDDTVDYTNVTLINATVLMAAENSAAQTIDNYLRHVYACPLAGAALTQEIVEICARLTWCELWRRRDYEPDTITTQRQTYHARLQRMSAGLDEVRDGKVTAKRTER